MHRQSQVWEPKTLTSIVGWIMTNHGIGHGIDSF